jgi:Mn-dependent DtxR family transcriptional regulator
MHVAGVSSETAEEDACRIEHYISQETFDGIKLYMNKIKPEEN